MYPFFFVSFFLLMYPPQGLQNAAHLNGMKGRVIAVAPNRVEVSLSRSLACSLSLLSLSSLSLSLCHTHTLSLTHSLTGLYYACEHHAVSTRLRRGSERV